MVRPEDECMLAKPSEDAPTTPYGGHQGDESGQQEGSVRSPRASTRALNASPIFLTTSIRGRNGGESQTYQVVEYMLVDCTGQKLGHSEGSCSLQWVLERVLCQRSLSRIQEGVKAASHLSSNARKVQLACGRGCVAVA